MLQQALELEEQAVAAASDTQGGSETSDTTPLENPAGTLINICTVLIGMGRYEDALQHACRASSSLCQQHHIKRADIESWCNVGPRPSATSQPHQSLLKGSNPNASVQQHPEFSMSDGMSEASVTQQTASKSDADQAVAFALRAMPIAQCSTLAMAFYNEAVALEHLVRQWSREHA